MKNSCIFSFKVPEWTQSKKLTQHLPLFQSHGLLGQPSTKKQLALVVPQQGERQWQFVLFYPKHHELPLELMFVPHI